MTTGELRLEGLRVIFNGGTPDERVALDGIDLTLAPGDYVTVIGPNGAGKSTLLNAIAGTVPAARGSIFLDGLPLTRSPEHRRSALIARVMQDPRINTCGDLTIGENLAFAERRGRSRSPFRLGRSRARLAESIRLLSEYGRGLSGRLGHLAGDLSGGQRQVLAMVMALANLPSLLLLDEHTSALDPEMADRVLELTDAAVRSTSVTTVMITHNMRQALEYGNRLLIMSEGRIVDDIGGAAKQALTEDALIERFRAVVAESVSDRLIA